MSTTKKKQNQPLILTAAQYMTAICVASDREHAAEKKKDKASQARIESILDLIRQFRATRAQRAEHLTPIPLIFPRYPRSGSSLLQS